MRIAVMQPYVFPYLGYFQLVGAVDRFVFFDDVNFIKKGWIHRNTILVNGKRNLFSVPLSKASQNEAINETHVHKEMYDQWRGKFEKTLEHSYRTTPYYDEVFGLVSAVLSDGALTISELAQKSILAVCDYLEIKVDFKRSSQIAYGHQQNGQEKILEICAKERATTYINAIGGKELYEEERFSEAGVDLKFIDSEPIVYNQGGVDFVDNLSIIDVLMFNDLETVKEMLKGYELIPANN